MYNLKLREKRIVEMVEATGDTGRIFGVVFQKRTTGQLRAMTCRLGVRKGVKGVGGSFEPSDKNLIRVYEMPEGRFRCIPVEGVRSLTVDGVRMAVA